MLPPSSLRQLRPFQEKALSVLEKPTHLVCVSPTGSGKSAIYEQHLLTHPTRALLISPLIALGRQQAQSLRLLGINTYLGMGPGAEYPSLDDTWEKPTRSQVWIVSPERLFQSPRAFEILSAWRPEFLIVDECHTLFEWGQDFRPEFAQIPSLLSCSPSSRSIGRSLKRSLWLSATLSHSHLQKIREFLPNPNHFLIHSELPETLDLKFFKLPLEHRLEFLTVWVRQERNQPGIVFVKSRKMADRLTRFLSGISISALGYHAGFSSEERKALEAAVYRNECRFIVATSAFGMGMDFGHLRSALFFNSPDGPLSLTQGIGRVTRNPSRESRAAVLWNDEEAGVLGTLFADSAPPRVALRRAMERC